MSARYSDQPVSVSHSHTIFVACTSMGTSTPSTGAPAALRRIPRRLPVFSLTCCILPQSIEYEKPRWSHETAARAPNALSSWAAMSAPYSNQPVVVWHSHTIFVACTSMGTLTSSTAPGCTPGGVIISTARPLGVVTWKVPPPGGTVTVMVRPELSVVAAEDDADIAERTLRTHAESFAADCERTR